MSTTTERVTVTEGERPKIGTPPYVLVGVAIGFVIGMVAMWYLRPAPPSFPASLPLSLVDRAALASELATAVKTEIGPLKGSIDNLTMSTAERRVFSCGPDSAPTRRYVVVVGKASSSSDLSLLDPRTICAGLPR